MPWTLRDAKRDRATIENIEKGDDRSAAILAGAYLEDRLTAAIKVRLISDAEVHGKLFKGYGPLATFSAKIDLAYLMGIMDKKTRDGFHTIREIRNRFAHRLDLDDFDSPMARDLCKKLFRADTAQRLLQKAKEDMSKSEDLKPFIQVLVMVISPLLDLPDTPRNWYMSAIKLHLLAIEILTVLATTPLA